MTKPLRILLPTALILAAAFAESASAQVSYGGTPPSATARTKGVVPTQTLAGLDRSVVVFEDLDQPPKDQPFRFGEPIDVDFTLGNSGVIEELVDGSRLWRLRISSRDAVSLNLMFSRYHLPDGAELYLYDDARTTLLGSYNALNNKPDGLFATEPIFADAINLEYSEPAWVDFTGELRVSQVIHGYRDVRVLFRKSGGGSFPTTSCEVDVACPEGLGWEQQIASVARILNGGSFCTGSLINNTAQDGTQFFISAAHCGNLSNAIFYFNYQNVVCGTFGVGNVGTVHGSQLSVIDGLNDTQLVILTEPIPASYGVYYNGWDATGATPPNTVTIHHPQGEPKKISKDNDAPVKSGNSWRILRWDLGATEGGSSGSPLFDPAGRFVGQLWGGLASCSNPVDDYYRRFELSYQTLWWALDTAGTGRQVLDGYDPNACGLPTTFGAGEIGSLGTRAQLGSIGGLPKVGNSSFAVTLTGVLPNVLGIAMAGQGTGTLVRPYGTILIDYPRFIWSYYMTDATGGYTTHFPVTTGMAGETWYMQFAAQDPGFGGGVQLSDGIEITFCP
ncbi:MAG: hypothetical protein V2A76_13355 [Planctomycetota bacterium]